MVVNEHSSLHEIQKFTDLLILRLSTYLNDFWCFDYLNN